MLNNVFTLEEFQSVMNEWYQVRQYQDEMNTLLRKHGDGFLYMPDCSWALQYALETMFCDTEEDMSNIEYFVYELDFGKKYVDGMIKDGEGNYIKMATVEDLYKMLMKGLNEDGK